MATEQTTIAEYALDSNNRRFIIPFEYLSRPFVQVTLRGNDRRPLTVGADYRFISINEIETTKAWGAVDGYLSIELRRVTSATDRLVEFSDGSVLRSRDMNVSAIQTIHIAEEARNLASDTLASDEDGNLDARGRRLVNLTDAVDLGDAVTYRQVQEWSGSAYSQANRAEREASAALVSQQAAKVSETKSKTSETNSKTSETNSKTSEVAALASEVAAKVSETNSKASEVAAKVSETNSKTSETNSKTSETNSKASEVLSQKWSDNPEDVTVVDGKYSARHWSEKAKSFANGDSYLAKASNLSDVKDKAASRANLGLKGAALKDVGTTAGTVAAGDDARILEAIHRLDALQPSITGSCTTNGTTGNTLSLTGIVPTLALEAGDVIQITDSIGRLNDKLFTVESITNDNSIVVNYEHAGNRANGVLKLADQTATITITRIAKWYTAPMGLGQTWLVLTAYRSGGATYTNTTGRPIYVKVVSGSTTGGSRTDIFITVDGVRMHIGLNTNSGGGVGASGGILVPSGSVYSLSTATTWWELR